MATSAAHPPPKRGSWSSVNSKQLIKNYDKSPIASPKNSPPQTPALSRNNSTASINSTRSEPAWHSQRHQSDASVGSSKTRKDSTSSQASTASHKKGGFMGGLFHKSTKEEKEAKAKETEKIVLGSKHAAAVKTKMMMDPKYREFQDKHKKPDVKTAGITGHTKSAHSSAATQEMRHPHSGPPAVHGDLDLPMLGRIESHDEPDSDEDAMDAIERVRREWNTAIEHNMAEIPEGRSRQVSSARQSPWASPIHSRETSPNRLSARPGIGGKRTSYAGGYHRDANGRWTKKTTPPAMTPVHPPQHGGVNADLLAASLAQRLDTHA